jgi:hypothetical protein
LRPLAANATATAESAQLTWTVDGRLSFAFTFRVYRDV